MGWQRLAFGLALLLGIGTAVAADVPDHIRFPNSSSAWRRAANAALERENKAGLVEAIGNLVRMGASLRAETFEQLKLSIDDEAKRTEFGDLLSQNRRAITDSMAFASIPADYRLVEGIAWDEAARRLFIGTVVDGRLAYLQRGRWHDVTLTGARGSIFGMAIDHRRSRLWLAMARVEQSAVDAPEFSGIMAVDLKTLKVVARVSVPHGLADVAPNDLAVARDGSIYVSDSRTGAVLQCKPGCKQLSVLTPSGAIGSAQGIVALPDGKRLIVADYRNGLWLVDRSTGKASSLPAVSPAMLDGIDGLLLDAGHNQLIAVQNGTSPVRIARFQMAANWNFVERVSVIEQNAPIWGEPTLLTQHGKADFLYIADGQWERFGAKGIRRDDNPLRETAVRLAPLLSTTALVANGSQ